MPDQDKTEISQEGAQEPKQFATEFDVILNRDDFLFNAGHTNVLKKLGVITDSQTIIVGQGNNSNWCVIDLSAVTPSLDTIGHIVELTGEELRQSDPNVDRSNLNEMKKGLNNPEIPEERKERLRNYIAEKEKTIDKSIDLYTHQAHAVEAFISRLSGQGIDFSQIPKYDSTNADIKRILSWDGQSS